MSELIKAIEEIGDTFKSFSKQSSKEVGELRDRLEQLEAGRDRPRLTGGSSSSREQVEHKNLFSEWLRKPNDASRKRRLEEAEHAMVQHKAISAGSGADGGFAVPELIQNEVERRLIDLNPLRQLVKVVQCGSGDYKHLLDVRGAGAAWVAETGSRSDSATPQLAERAPSFGELYSYPAVWEWALDDIYFNVEQWLTEVIAEEFAAAECQAIVDGNGTSKPTGLLAASPVSTLDDASPLRANGTLKYVPLGSYASPAALTHQTLQDMVADLKTPYLSGEGVAWVMSRGTWSEIQKMDDSTGRPIVPLNLIAGAPPTLLGHEVVLADAMPAIGAGTFPILFGNFRRAYLLAERTQIRILPNPYSVPGKVSFYCRRRIGGCVLNGHAVRALKYSVS